MKVRKAKLGELDLKTAAAYRSLGFIHFEIANYDEALDNLEHFIHIKEAKKVKNTVEYILGLQLAGDIYKYFMKTDDASSAYSAAFHTYSHNRDLKKRYPQFGPVLEKRLVKEEQEEPEEEAAMAQGGLFARITQAGRLGDEVKLGEHGGLIESTEEEIALRQSIVFFD